MLHYLFLLTSVKAVVVSGLIPCHEESLFFSADFSPEPLSSGVSGAVNPNNSSSSLESTTSFSNNKLAKSWRCFSFCLSKSKASVLALVIIFQKWGY